VDPRLCLTPQDLEDCFSDFGLLGSPSDDWSISGFTNGPYFPQSGLLTPLMSSMPRTLDALGSKAYDDREIPERGIPLRKPGFHSQSCGSEEINERQLQNLTDICLTYGIASQDMIQDKNIISKAFSPWTQNLQDTSAEIMPPPGSRFSTKVSNLNSSKKNDSPVLLVGVVVEQTNDTQQGVQDFLAKANQPSKPSRSRSSSDSPSRKVQTTWEHTFVPQGLFTDATSDPPSRRSSQKLAKRTRPLSGDTRAKAKEMRKLRSCLRCRMSKIAVSCISWPKKTFGSCPQCTTDEICGPCSKAPQSLFSGMICVRAHLKDYLNLFLPGPYSGALDMFLTKLLTCHRTSRAAVSKGITRSCHG
jgi:hypothetical protein